MSRRALLPALVALAAATAGCGSGDDAPHANSRPSQKATPGPTPLAAGPWKPGPSLELRSGTVGGAASLVFPGKDDASVAFVGDVSAEIPVRRIDPKAGVAYEGSLSYDRGTRVVGSPAFDRTGRGVVVFETPTSDTDGGAEVLLQWAGMDRHGGIGPVHTLAKAAEFPAFSADADGDAVVSWIDPSPGGMRADFRAAVQRRSQAFAPAVTLTTSGTQPYLDGNGIRGNSFVATVDSTGRLLAGGLVLVGTDDSAIQAWTGTVDAGFTEAPITVAAEGGEGFAAAITKDGRGCLAWGYQLAGEEADSPWLVRTSSIPPGARSATPVQEVEHGLKEVPAALPALVADPRGGALLAWNDMRTVRGSQTLTTPVLLSEAGQDGRFGKPTELASDGALSALVVDPGGAAIVTWTSAAYGSADPATDTTFAASVRGAESSRFGDAERVPIPFPGDAPLPAFDAAGRPAVAYTEPRTEGARGDSIHLLIRDAP